jgi:hypothetical protein
MRAWAEGRKTDISFFGWRGMAVGWFDRYVEEEMDMTRDGGGGLCNVVVERGWEQMTFATC